MNDPLSDDYRLRSLVQKLLWRGFSAGLRPRAASAEIDVPAVGAWIVCWPRGVVFEVAPSGEDRFLIAGDESPALEATEIAVVEFFERVRR